MRTSDFIILNGFDRSGTSAISRTLSAHPQAELIMQPFNSGFVRKSINEPLEKSAYISQARTFFDSLTKNKLEDDLIQSHWHVEFSTTKKYIPNKLHIVKTTINHFAQKMMLVDYSGIDVWGIWRNPYDIYHSIKKNDFQDKWYDNAFEELKVTVSKTDVLKKVYGFLLKENLSLNQQLAFTISVRSYYFMYYLEPSKLINYEIFKAKPNEALNNFISFYELDDFDFSVFQKNDLNIVGHKFDPKKKSSLTTIESLEIEPIFEPILELYNQKFQHD